MTNPGENQGGVSTDGRPDIVYRAARKSLSAAARVTVLKTHGLHNIDSLNNNQQGSVIASSHDSMWDVANLATLKLDRCLRFLGRSSLLKHPMLGLPIRAIAPHAGVIFLDRESKISRGQAADEALRAVNGGDLVAFFPEQTRNKTDNPAHLGDFKPGAARTASKAEGTTVLLPIAQGYEQGLLFNRSPIHCAMVIGEPIFVDQDFRPGAINELNIHLHDTIAELKAQAVDLAHS